MLNDLGSIIGDNRWQSQYVIMYLDYIQEMKLLYDMKTLLIYCALYIEAYNLFLNMTTM